MTEQAFHPENPEPEAGPSIKMEQKKFHDLHLQVDAILASEWGQAIRSTEAVLTPDLEITLSKSEAYDDEGDEVARYSAILYNGEHEQQGVFIHDSNDGPSLVIKPEFREEFFELPQTADPKLNELIVILQQTQRKIDSKDPKDEPDWEALGPAVSQVIDEALDASNLTIDTEWAQVSLEDETLEVLRDPDGAMQLLLYNEADEQEEEVAITPDGQAQGEIKSIEKVLAAVQRAEHKVAH